MIILDTNVISAMMRPGLNPIIVAWLDTQRIDDLRLTSVSLHEITFGIERSPLGRKRASLETSLAEILRRELGATILDFDADAAWHSGICQLKADRAVGHYDIPDCLVAGTAVAHGASVATRNIRDFRHFGIPLKDPWLVTP